MISLTDDEYSNVIEKVQFYQNKAARLERELKDLKKAAKIVLETAELSQYQQTMAAVNELKELI